MREDRADLLRIPGAAQTAATEGGERQEDSSFGGKFSPELDFALEARKFYLVFKAKNSATGP